MIKAVVPRNVTQWVATATMLLAALACLLSFLALQEARNATAAATSAAHASFGDSSQEIYSLRQELLRAGVIGGSAAVEQQ
jgi:hypothetical protein